MRHTEEKKELFDFLLSIDIITHNQTYQANKYSHKQPENTKGPALCCHQEVDWQMMVHTANVASKYKTVLIHTIESDVVILAVLHFRQAADQQADSIVNYTMSKFSP